MHRVVVLIDGFAEQVASGRHRAGGTVTLVLGRPNILVDTGDPSQGDALLAALAREGIGPDQVAYVINTHGHLDHVGNNGLFRSAIFVLDGDVAQGGEYWAHDFDAGPYEIPADDGGPSISVIRTTGHTDHDLTVLVTTDAGRVAIAGDLFEHADDVHDGSWQQWSRDPARQRASREVVHARADFIVPGHGAMFPVRRQHTK